MAFCAICFETLAGTKTGTPNGKSTIFCMQTNSHSATMTEIAFISLTLKALNFAVWSDKCSSQGVPLPLPIPLRMPFLLGKVSLSGELS
jgi:hypothetical protein